MLKVDYCSGDDETKYLYVPGLYSLRIWNGESKCMDFIKFDFEDEVELTLHPFLVMVTMAFHPGDRTWENEVFFDKQTKIEIMYYSYTTSDKDPVIHKDGVEYQNTGILTFIHDSDDYWKLETKE